MNLLVLLGKQLWVAREMALRACEGDYCRERSRMTKVGSGLGMSIYLDSTSICTLLYIYM